MGFPLIFGVVVVFLRITTIMAVSMVKPDCPEKCGNLSIPYPFGIGHSCSADSSFTITCNGSSVPILSSINLEVVNILLEDGLIAVKHPLSPPLNCSSTQKTQSVGLSLLGSPYTINGENNELFVLGCQNDVSLPDNEMSESSRYCRDLCLRYSTATSCGGVCRAICDHIYSTDSSCYSNTSCDGVCGIPIPTGLQELEFNYTTVDSSSSNISCGYVFLADQNWLQEEISKTGNGTQRNLSNSFGELGYTILVLEWVLDNQNLSYYATAGCYYSGVPSGYNYYSTRSPCTCEYGFEGNPYIASGCHDINECVINATRAICNGYNCINIPGSFKCDYPENHVKLNHVVKTITTILGSVVGTLTLLLVGWKYSKVVRKRIEEKRRVKFFKRNGGLLLEQHLSANGCTVEKIKLFRSKELARATDHYNENRILGRGGQGTVYKGMLTDGRIVAVKKSKRINQGEIETFINEVVILAHLNHRNIVRLLGCCLETEIPLLVYEFIPNGTLFQHMHDPNDEFPLTWEMRVRIATEVANSLSYLHSAASSPIYHRDIKSSNILLDEKYQAKLSDFGTSRSVAIDQTHLTTRVLGTFGYLDPEYFRSSHFTEKSDVYSFGVVVVELLTGEMAVSTVREEGKSLAIHFLQSMEEDNLFDILDPLVLEQGPKEEVLAIAQLARRCLYLNGKKRPTMKQVEVELEGIMMSKQRTAFQHDHDKEDEVLSAIDECSSDFDTITSTTSSVHNHLIFIDEP